MSLTPNIAKPNLSQPTLNKSNLSAVNSKNADLSTLRDIGFIYRALIMFVFGVIIALCLTWFMHALIESSQKELDESVRANLLDFVRISREETSQRKNVKAQRPEMDEAPPAPAAPQADPQGAADVSLNVALPQIENNIDVDVSIDMGVSMGDGEYLPIVKMSPTYPAKAMMNEIEGSCLVTYTVTVTGATKDIQVVEGECPRIFARSAKLAAKKFKYKPRVIDGEAVEVPNVFNRFDFTLFKVEEDK